ncbi:hypothetical protein BC628DRAFT_1422616 [Trametes gibbosa]|nr:hypothetical protein BC628DRAFT_1422616 [Trametes gibbosa]
MVSSRLPSYRESYTRRFHPYPCAQRRSARAAYLLMTSADNHGYSDEETRDGWVLVPAAVEDRTDGAETGSQEDVANLERALHPGDLGRGTQRTLATLAVELALAVRKAVRNPLIVLKKQFSAARLNAGVD